MPKPFRAVATYFNGRYWGREQTVKVQASHWTIAIARAARALKMLKFIIRMKPGDKLTITLECLRPIKFSESTEE